MTPERWQQVKELFNAALECDAGQRTAFLQQACSGDVTLQQQVESLLAMHESSDRLLDGSVGALAAELLTQAQPPPLVGQSLGVYQVERHVGRGGMGEVYLARDTRLGRPVAVKLLPASFHQDPDRVRRFQQEARATSLLNHPNIVTIHEVAESAGLRFIVSEFVEGKTLREMIKAASLKLDQALDIVIQTASALAAAHQAGIVHRDIKPENIMVRPDGYVKVLDFGLAKLSERLPQKMPGEQQADAAASSSELSTQTGTVMGTVKYMSPEQARGQRVDHRTDIFSLGIVLYETITGRPPFEGETASHTIVAILEQEPQPISAYAPDAPAELQEVIDSALRKNREDRYRTVGAMLNDLKEVRDDAAYRARQERHSSEVSGRQDAVVAAQTRRGQRRNRALIWAAILAVAAAALALGAYEYLRARRAASTQSAKMARITANGKIAVVALSRDGRYTAYVTGLAEQQSLWVMQGNAGGLAQIIPPTDGAQYWGLTFANDGNSLYYVRNMRNGPWELYRVPTLGGTPKRLLVNIDSAVTFSPDGARFAFVRNISQDETELVIANADGSGERPLARRKRPDYFLATGVVKISWSPDGEKIACPAGNDELPSGYSMDVVEVRVRDGTVNTITRQKWAVIQQVAWLGGGSDLVLVGRDQLLLLDQLWLLSYSGGEARRLTNDLNWYRDMSVAADAIVAVQRDVISNIWIAPEGDADRARQITDTRLDGVTGLSWTPDGRVVSCSYVNGNADLWIMDADGGHRRQLTDDAGWDALPSVSPDGRYVVFVSDRAGIGNLWRIDIDGSNLVQLTKGNGENQPYCPPDGRWVYYISSKSDKGLGPLWKVPLDGGDPILLINRMTTCPVVSPDHKLMALGYWDVQATPPFGIDIASVEGGRLVKRLDLAPTLYYCWTPDGRAIAHVDSRFVNVWGYPLDGGKPAPLTNFKTDQTFYFRWSRDGKQLALARGTITSDVVLISDFK